MTDKDMPAAGGNCNLTIVEHEGEPRVRDVVLGKKLGMKRPTNIRALIERHLPALEMFGGVCTTVVQTSKKGGKPGGIEYLLTEEQAVYIVTQSDAPNALETKVQVVKVFVAWRHGHLVPTSEASELDIRTNGIARSTIHKVTKIEKEIDGIGQAVIEVAREMVAQGKMLRLALRSLEEMGGQVNGLMIANDPRVAAVERIAPLDIALKHGVPPRGRQNFCKTIGDQMAKISANWEVAVALSQETRRRLFTVPVADYWLNHGGRDIIAQHNAKKAGQGVLKLVPPKGENSGKEG